MVHACKNNGNSGKSIISLFYEGTFIMNRFMCFPKFSWDTLDKLSQPEHRTHGGFSPGKKNKKMQRGWKGAAQLMGPRPKKTVKFFFLKKSYGPVSASSDWCVAPWRCYPPPSTFLTQPKDTIAFQGGYVPLGSAISRWFYHHQNCGVLTLKPGTVSKHRNKQGFNQK